MTYKEEVFKCNVILKIAPPTLEEIDLLLLIKYSFHHYKSRILSQEYLAKTKTEKVIALAMEYLKSDDGYFPIVRIMSEIAGMESILTAAEILSKSSGWTRDFKRRHFWNSSS